MAEARTKAGECDRRETQGLVMIDKHVTISARKDLGGEDEATARCIQNGGYLTKHKLYHMGKCDDNTCQFCGKDVETVEHVLWECPFFNEERIAREGFRRRVHRNL